LKEDKEDKAMGANLQVGNHYPIQTKVKQRSYVGYIAWLIQRITAIALLVLLPLKIYSGYASVGKLPGSGALASLHLNPVVDALLLTSVIFHSLYGMRVIFIDLGWVKDNRDVFTVFTTIGVILVGISFYVMVI
jgi:succinate dehydrogenase hydrophobic anchor subunit